MKDLGKIKEAEFCYLKAIEINSSFADPYTNLGNVLKTLAIYISKVHSKSNQNKS